MVADSDTDTDKGSQEVMVGAAWLTAPVFDPETQQQSYLLSGRSAMGPEREQLPLLENTLL